jgi:hypothetical protein
VRYNIQLLKEMGANTIRTYFDFGITTNPPLIDTARAVLDYCYQNGIMVIMTVDEGTANGYQDRIASVVNEFKNHPAILFWSLGNEWNINHYYGIYGNLHDAAAATQANALRIKSQDTNHPVASILGDINYPEPDDVINIVNNTCTAVDVWGSNIYRGSSFGELFNEWKGRSTKPLFLAEFGTDAFHSTSWQQTSWVTGHEDQAEQAEFLSNQWSNLEPELSANDPTKVCLGGTVFEWNDEWWKTGRPDVHGNGGYDTYWNDEAHPDGYANEEWFGIVSVNRRRRQAYYSLQTSWKSAVYDVYVDDSNHAGDDTDLDDSFRTIQAGVNAVPQGGAVHVADGTYPENVTISKTLNIHANVPTGSVDSIAFGAGATDAVVEPGQQSTVGRLHVLDAADFSAGTNSTLRTRVRGLGTAPVVGTDYDQMYSSTGTMTLGGSSKLILDLETLANQCGTICPAEFDTLTAGSTFASVDVVNNTGGYTVQVSYDEVNGDVLVDLVCSPSTLQVTNTDTLQPRFNWGAVPGANSYELKVVEKVSQTTICEETATAPHDCPVELVHGTTYEWCVRTVRGTLKSNWRQGTDFTITLLSVTVTATDATASEPGTDAGTFTFTRLGDKSAALTVNFAVSGTATSGADYTALGTSVTIPAGASTTTKTVKPINNLVAELDETVVVTLAAGTGYDVGTPNSATVTILDDDAPTIMVAATDAAANESGDTGTFTFTRLGKNSAALMVKYTVSGTATNGTDYQPIGTTVAIPAGAASATVTVTPLVDLVAELDETVVVMLATGTGYRVGTAKTATVTIADSNTPAVTVTATIPGGGAEAGPTSGQFTFTRRGDKSVGLTVNFSVAGTANTTGGVDYGDLGTSVSIPSGQSTVTLPVTPVNDTIAELDETVVLTVEDGAGYTVGAAKTATVTIADDEAPVVTVEAMDATASEPGTDTGTFMFTRYGNKKAVLLVRFTVSGTATANGDYTALGTYVSIRAGVATVTKTVKPVNNTLAENDETAIVTLVAGMGYAVGTPNTATVTIIDDELPMITVVATDATASEPGTDTGTFTFTRTGRLLPDLTVNFTVGGTATKDVDYSDIGTTVQIPSGQTNATLTVTPIIDTTPELDKTILVTLAAGSGYTVGTAKTTTVTIADKASPVVTVAATDATASEPGTDPGTFTFTRLGDKSAALTVNFAVSGTASETDYTAIGTSVTIPAGASTATKIVKPINNFVAELDETVVVTLAAGTGYAVGSPASATVTILDNDTPTITVVATGSTVAEGSSGVFTITRLGKKSVGLTVKFTVSGTASNGVDYQTIGTTVAIPAGASTATLTVSPVQDGLVEGNESVILSLTAGIGYTVGTTKTAMITITDVP